ncbi:MAG TPA: Wzz/FepE/Etk N-terminal domain-containing protein [Bryobacteraceae bacterium]|nr:Wzz/FepE/Etk N-terminal domain-containing protein [Bryobacteraceae bacterium]
MSDEISFGEIASALKRRRKPIGRAVLITAVLSTILAFVLPVKYTAEAVILTPQQSQSSLSTMAQLAGSGAAGGLSGLTLLAGLGFHSQTDLYVGILESRSIADALITKFNLQKIYGDRDLYGARKRLARNTTIRAGRDTLIHVRVQDGSAKRAAQIANGYVEELARQNATVALTEAAQRRVFFEQQLAKEKALLATSEAALRDTQQSTGLVAPGGQADALMRALTQLHTEILTREAQLQAIKTYITDDNPHFQALQRELAALRGELARLEQGKHSPGNPEVPAEDLPQAGLEYLRSYRAVKYHETLFEILAKEYEAARLDEARSGSLVQVIDKAVPPERKSWPPRTLMVLISTALASLISGFWAVTASNRARSKEYERYVPSL